MIAEKFEDLKSSAEERWSDVSEYMDKGGERLSQIVEDRPAGVLLFSCLAGFAVGLLISRALESESSSSSWDTSAERFGRKFMDKLDQVMPAMLRERFSR